MADIRNLLKSFLRAAAKAAAAGLPGGHKLPELSRAFNAVVGALKAVPDNLEKAKSFTVLVEPFFLMNPTGFIPFILPDKAKGRRGLALVSPTLIKNDKFMGWVRQQGKWIFVTE